MGQMRPRLLDLPSTPLQYRLTLDIENYRLKRRIRKVEPLLPLPMKQNDLLLHPEGAKKVDLSPAQWMPFPGWLKDAGGRRGQGSLLPSLKTDIIRFLQEEACFSFGEGTIFGG